MEELKVRLKKKAPGLIPDDAEKPIDGRISTGKYVKKIINPKVKSLPIGISDYVRAQSEYYYVDKTLLIKEFLDQKAFSVIIYKAEKIWKNLEYGYAPSFF